MRVDRVEVEFADDQEDDRFDRGQARETASAALGGLEQAVDGLQESIGLARLRPSDDALQVTAHEGGNIFHGEMDLDQLFFMRPVAGWANYRTPIRNLYLCGSGTHPGGGVMGAPGYNAAREILKDVKR